MSDEMKKDVNVTTDQEELTKTAPAAEPTTAASTPNPDLDAVRAKLGEYGADMAAIEHIINGLGVESIDDLSALEVSDLTAAGIKLVKARKLITEFSAPAQAAPVQAVTAAESRAMAQGQLETLLPPVPNDDSWLNALKSGGILKVDDSSYIAAIRAAMAERAGLYNVPAALAEAMERYADETEEQVDPTFFALRKSLTRRNYADIFAAIDGLDGSFITESRRKEFLTRIRTALWPAITDSFRALDSWYQTWRASFSDPSMIIAAIGGGLGAGAGMGMVTPPDTASLHDAGDTLVDSINRVFRGTGVQVAAAMAYDANTIRNTLEKPGLPAMVGVKNRELMLKKIHANVSSNYVRLEQNLVKYVLGFVKHDTVTSDVEVQYFAALWQLGTQINWNELNGGSNVGIEGLTGERVL